MTESIQIKDLIYEVGDIVPEDGYYACVPCGDRKFFKSGVRFTGCLTCFGRGRREFQKGLELWEKIEVEKVETVSDDSGDKSI